MIKNGLKIINEIKAYITLHFDSKVKVYCMYDAGNNKILFGLKEKDSDEEPMDPWYLFDKRTKEIKNFTPYEDIKAFNYALKHPIEK